MLTAKIHKILTDNPEYSAIIPVLEKEILHHDIINVLVRQGAMQRLTFIGGTSLRMCYNSARLSTDEIRDQLKKLIIDSEVENDFKQEMSRFVPAQIKKRTIDQPEYWPYLQDEVRNLVNAALNSVSPKQFDMS